MIPGRISPSDTPSLNGRVPNAQGGAEHIEFLVELRGSDGTRGHDPDILHSATFEHPGCMDFAFYAFGRNVNRPVMQDVEFPASDKPAIEILLFRDFVRTARSH